MEQTWFDEGTRNKIDILGKDPGPILRELVNAQDLPKVYGGEMEWTFVDEPSLDEDAKKALGEDRMLRGPVLFRGGKADKAL